MQELQVESVLFAAARTAVTGTRMSRVIHTRDDIDRREISALSLAE